MKKENKKEKNSFVFFWGSCILFLGLLCFLGISDSMKSTLSACTDTAATAPIPGCNCQAYKNSYGDTRYDCSGTGAGTGSQSTSSCDNSCIYQYIPSGYECTSYQNGCGKTCYKNCVKKEDSGDTVTYCSDHSGAGQSVCESNGCYWDATNNICGKNPPSCSSYSGTGNMQNCINLGCYWDSSTNICASTPPSSDDDGEEDEEGNFYGTLAEVLDKCKALYGSECSCIDLGAVGNDGTHSFNCTPKSGYTCDGGKTFQTEDTCKKTGTTEYLKGSSEATCANLYGEGWSGSCRMLTNSYQSGEDGKPMYRYTCECSKDATEFGKETEEEKEECSKTGTACYMYSATGRYFEGNRSTYCGVTGYIEVDSSKCSLNADIGSKTCSKGYYFGNNAIASNYGLYLCGQDNYNLNAVVGEPGCYAVTCEEACDCGEGDCSKGMTACWSHDGKYTYEYHETVANDGWKAVDTSYCSGNVTGCWKCNDGTFKKGASSSICSTLVNSSYCSSNPPSVDPVVPGDPIVPELPSSGSSSSSSDENVKVNPPTGQITIFIVWVVAAMAIVYSVWYFKKVKEN